MNDKSHVSVIGPCSPPVGGVSIMNESVQRILRKNYVVESHDTSTNGDASGRKVALKLFVFFRGLVFIGVSRSKVINIFATSGAAFFRDAMYIFYSLLRGKKVVVHLHTKKRGEFFLSRYLINVFGWVLGFADVVLVLSGDHKEFFANYIPRRKLKVLENFVFNMESGSREDRLFTDLMYVGRLTKIKGIYDLIDAIELTIGVVPDIFVHVLGNGLSLQEYDELLGEVDRRGLSDNFRFYGEVVGDKKADIFSLCPVLIFPSHFENSPVVLKEALAAKQVIICSDIDANILALDGSDDEAVFTYPVGDAKNLSRQILNVYEKREYLTRLSTSIICPETCTSEYALKTLTEVYDNLLE